MTVLLASLILALTRAEIIERMRAPVLTQCNGLVEVYASCPEDMRREYQMPIASFTAETIKTICAGLSISPERSKSARIVVYVGSGRTNDPSVVTRAFTNRLGAVSRIHVKSPGYADIGRLRIEIIKAFSRAVLKQEIGDDEAIALYRKSDPRIRLSDERERLFGWLSGKAPSPTPESDEENLARMRRVLEPGVSTRADVMLFASRLFLYPFTYDSPFCGKFDKLSFREAIACAKVDPFVRLAAFQKSGLVIVYGGGRGETLSAASKLYFDFLQSLARSDSDEKALRDMLEAADSKLNEALEEACKQANH